MKRTSLRPYSEESAQLVQATPTAPLRIEDVVAGVPARAAAGSGGRGTRHDALPRHHAVGAHARAARDPARRPVEVGALLLPDSRRRDSCRPTHPHPPRFARDDDAGTTHLNHSSEPSPSAEIRRPTMVLVWIRSAHHAEYGPNRPRAFTICPYYTLRLQTTAARSTVRYSRRTTSSRRCWTAGASAKTTSSPGTARR